MSECSKVGYSATLARAHVHNFICSENRGLTSLCLAGMVINSWEFCIPTQHASQHIRSCIICSFFAVCPVSPKYSLLVCLVFQGSLRNVDDSSSGVPQGAASLSHPLLCVILVSPKSYFLDGHLKKKILIF